MDALPVSVVIVSRERPDLLFRAVTGVSQLDYDNFELIVVACSAGQAKIAAYPDVSSIKTVSFDEPNIATARNLGISQAAGEIIAFIDDDAVPEPQWLNHLVAPFANDRVAATGGYVIGRNGFSYQWRARSLSNDGFTHPIDLKRSESCVLRPTLTKTTSTLLVTKAIKTEGTNMAIRRDILSEIGGFDPDFAFYMDETDLNMRIALAGHATAIVPKARVHHGFAQSVQRMPDRTPRNLQQIGRSTAAFLKRYTPRAVRAKTWQAHRNEQRLRCLRAMQKGSLAADDVLRLMRGLERGYREGQARQALPLSPLPPNASPLFRPFPGRPQAPHQVISGRNWQEKRKRCDAKKAAKSGSIVTLYLLSLTARYHSKKFEDGVWVQRGGLFGKADRRDRALTLTTHKKRVALEIKKCDMVNETRFFFKSD